MKIETLDAQTLSYDLRARVIDECRSRAALHPIVVIIYVVFTLLFGSGAITLLEIAVSSPEKWYIGLIALPFASVPFVLSYTIILRPKQLVKLAEECSYTYYIGRLTGTKITESMDSNRNVNYYLRIDNIITCACTKEQYINAGAGNRYIVLYFKKRKPEMCLEVY